MQDVDDETHADKKKEIVESRIGVDTETGSKRSQVRELNRLTKLVCVTW